MYVYVYFIYIYILCIYIYYVCMYVCIYIMYMYIRIYVYESKLWEVLPFGIFRQVQPQRLRRQQLWQIRRRALGGLSFRLRWTGVPQTAPIPHHLTSKYRGIHELMKQSHFVKYCSIYQKRCDNYIPVLWLAWLASLPNYVPYYPTILKYIKTHNASRFLQNISI